MSFERWVVRSKRSRWKSWRVTGLAMPPLFGVPRPRVNLSLVDDYSYVSESLSMSPVRARYLARDLLAAADEAEGDDR